MLRTAITNLNQSLRTSVYNISGNAIGVQSVRWARKPRKPIHLGTAKSKMFRVPIRKKEDPEERAELMRLNKNYKTQMRSLLRFMEEDVIVRESTSRSNQIIVTPEEEAADLYRRFDLNDAWNAECAALRHERLAKEKEKRHEFLLKRAEDRENMDAEKFRLSENLVRHEKEQSETFILPEQIDEAIEEALNHPTDFNYAIDLRQNIYYGRRTVKDPNHLPGGSGGEQPLQLESSN